MNELTAVEILRKARAVLVRNGLNKGYFFDRTQAKDGTEPADCRVCSFGALRVAVGGTPVAAFARIEPEYEAYRVAAELLQEVAGVPYFPEWQDRPERTLAEVLTTFDKAIELAEVGVSA